MNNFWTITHYLIKLVYIDMVNVVLYLIYIRFKYMLETNKYNQVDLDILWAQIFLMVSTIKFTFSSIKKAKNSEKSCLEYILY